MEKENQSEAFTLRQKAEEWLRRKQSTSRLNLSVSEMQDLIHELEVRQIELEMKNEELLFAKEQVAEFAKIKYIELYDFSPSGYFTLSKEGKIMELNLTGAKILGKDRSHLKNNKFSLFISTDTRPIFHLFLKKVFKSNSKETCEVILSMNGIAPMNVHMTGCSTENGEQCIVHMVWL